MTPSRPTARDLRKANRAAILRSLYFDGQTSRLELSQATGLSAATVTNLVAELLADGVLREAGSEESQGGRPRTRLTVAEEVGYFVGVDVGENVIRIELFDLRLQPIQATQLADADSLRSPQVVATRIAAGIQTLLQMADVRGEQLIGVGVGVPGVVERAAETTVFAPSIGWRNVAFLAALEARLPYPIFLDNGAKAMAQAEALVGGGRGVPDVVTVLIGTGIGAGIIVENRLFRGATNSAGEWGHMKVAPDGRLCRCGSRGCLEAYLGARALLARWAELAGAPPSTADSEEEQIAALLTAYQRHDTAARQVVDEATRYLSLGVANLVNLFNPQRIMLGGWVGLRLGPVILDAVRQMVQRDALQPPFSAVTIDLCHLGQDAVALGAATLALEAFLTSGGKSHILATSVSALTS